MRYWLLKTEPSTYSIDDLAREKTTAWTGVRNYQARNFMRDGMQPGDRCLICHSSCEEPGIAGIVEVCRAAYPDETQFDRKSRYYDTKSIRNNPRWFNVDVRFVKKTPLLGLAALRGRMELRNMQVLKRGNRLSVTPVTEAEWDCIMRLLEKA